MLTAWWWSAILLLRRRTSVAALLRWRRSILSLLLTWWWWTALKRHCQPTSHEIKIEISREEEMTNVSVAVAAGSLLLWRIGLVLSIRLLVVL